MLRREVGRLPSRQAARSSSFNSQLELSREALTQALEAYRIVEARFRVGAVDFINVLDAQRTVFQANDAVVQAALDRYTAVVNLYTAVGGGWDGV